jgi:hypothetical protein
MASLVVHPDDAEIVYGGGKGLYQSGDGGASWIPLYPEMQAHALAIVPNEPRLLYAATDEGVARSTDGGMSWALACPGGLVNGPAEFLDIVAAPAEPYPVILLARPTRPDLRLPSRGICWDSTVPRYDLHQGWRQSKGGLPVFIKKHGG